MGGIQLFSPIHIHKILSLEILPQFSFYVRVITDMSVRYACVSVSTAVEKNFVVDSVYISWNGNLIKNAWLNGRVINRTSG
jgi:hypothetical protein